MVLVAITEKTLVCFHQNFALQYYAAYTSAQHSCGHSKHSLVVHNTTHTFPWVNGFMLRFEELAAAPLHAGNMVAETVATQL